MRALANTQQQQKAEACLSMLAIFRFKLFELCLKIKEKEVKTEGEERTKMSQSKESSYMLRMTKHMQR